MKKSLWGLLLCLLIVFCLLPTAALAEGVAIDETNFPDEIFRDYLMERFGDTLEYNEIAATTHINVSFRSGISSLTGIEYFTALQTLNCSYNSLTALDLSSNAALEYLNCSYNYITDTAALIDWLSDDNHNGWISPQNPPRLATPTGLAWDETIPGKAAWNAVTNASGYSVQLYKDGAALGRPFFVPSGTEYDFTSVIPTTGVYTFNVTATGDGKNHSDSNSAESGLSSTLTSLNQAALCDALNVTGGTLLFSNDVNIPWVIDDTTYPQAASDPGRVTARSAIEEQYYADTSISLSTSAEKGKFLRYDYFVSSEPYLNYLELYVNGGRTEGHYFSSSASMTGFASAAYEIPEDGDYTFTWTYRKNAYMSGGLDAAWLDNIEIVDQVTPTINFTVQPNPNTSVTAGSISSYLTAAASVLPSGTAELKWYACNSSGSTISNSSLGTGGTFTLPADLAAGTHHYLCQATYEGATAVNSNVATVTVSAAPAIIFTIDPATTPVAGTAKSTITGSLSGLSAGAAARLVVAVYDAQGRMVDLSMRAVQGNVSNGAWSTQLQLPPGEYVIKAFLLDSAAGFRPVAATPSRTGGK